MSQKVASKSRKKLNTRLFKKHTARSRKRLVRWSLLVANIAILGVVTLLVTSSPTPNSMSVQGSIIKESDSAVIADPLDQLSSADIAVHVARMANLAETPSVINHADSVNAKLAVAPVDDAIAPKPQIVSTDLKSKKDIKKYTVQEGDTVTSVANAHGVTSDSIRWSNDITGDGLRAGQEIFIPPVNGIVYEVKQGDTVDALAERFSADKQKLIEMNDAELAGLVAGQYIIIPDGTQPVRRPAYTAANYGYQPLVYGPYNGYDYGWCTWHAANRRMEIGRPLPTNLGNAITWYSIAQRGGHATGTVPQAGAVLWDANIGGLGHVAFVEKVNEDGSILVSDMNYPYWGRITYRTVTPNQFHNYRFIY